MQRFIPRSAEKRRRLRNVIQIEVIVITMVAFGFLLPTAGSDLVDWHLPFASGCNECAYNPWYARWLMAPLTWVPFEVVRPLLAGLSIGVFMWASNRLETAWWVVVLAFPMLGQLWLGQIDAYVVVGLLLALESPNPYVRGAGMVLAMIKPQNALIPILILLWHDQDRLKTLIVPIAIFVLSLVVIGPLWPLEWFELLVADRADIATDPLWNWAALWPWGGGEFRRTRLCKGCAGSRNRCAAGLRPHSALVWRVCVRRIPDLLRPLVGHSPVICVADRIPVARRRGHPLRVDAPHGLVDRPRPARDSGTFRPTNRGRPPPNLRASEVSSNQPVMEKHTAHLMVSGASSRRIDYF